MRSTSGPVKAGHTSHRFVYRILAVLLGLLPLVGLEVAFRVADWGRPTELADPYVGFTALRPLFVLDESGQRYQIDPARHPFFRPAGFSAKKGEREFRIFCLGGSTVQGRPYAIETSFTTWLELSLQAADPRYDWRVVNCGGISYASYRLAPILDEVLDYSPDLVILYTGHNEFLEDRTYRQVKETPAVVRYLHSLCTRLRGYNLLRSRWLRVAKRGESKSEPQNELPEEVDAFLDYRGGLADYHRDDAWKEGAVGHYQWNLTRMIAHARAAGVPALLVNPVSNLRDCPPFKIAFRPDLSADQRAAFDALCRSARAYRGHDPEHRIHLVQQALAIDERHAGAHFLLGHCYERVGRYEEAAAAYLRAKEEDICALRMIEPLHSALRAVARETGTPVVDARALFERESRQRIPGAEWLLDHIHPSVNGHQRIAAALLDEMTRMRLVRLQAGWKQRQKQRFAAHLKTLPDTYFVHGQQRLQGLIRWTQGRAHKLKRTSGRNQER